MNSYRVFVTGAAGFLGANLVRRLLADGASVVALLRPTSDPWRLPLDHCNLQLHRCDLEPTDAGNWASLGLASTVYHLAASGLHPSLADAPAMAVSNVAATLAALKLAVAAKARRFLYVGSSAEYGTAIRAREDRCPAPTSIYGGSKSAGAVLAHSFGRQFRLDVTSVRPFSVYGPYEAAYRLIPYCVLRALEGSPLEVTDGRQTRDYVMIDDVIDGIIRAANTPAAAGRILNLCSGTSTSVRDVVTMIARVAGAGSEIKFGSRRQSSTEMWETSGDPSEAKAVLGWSARVPLLEGISQTVRWFTEHRSAFHLHYGSE